MMALITSWQWALIVRVANVDTAFLEHDEPGHLALWFTKVSAGFANLGLGGAAAAGGGGDANPARPAGKPNAQPVQQGPHMLAPSRWP